jgi:hypothetical protein
MKKIIIVSAVLLINYFAGVHRAAAQNSDEYSKDVYAIHIGAGTAFHLGIDYGRNISYYYGLVGGLDFSTNYGYFPSNDAYINKHWIHQSMLGVRMTYPISEKVKLITCARIGYGMEYKSNGVKGVAIELSGGICLNSGIYIAAVFNIQDGFDYAEDSIRGNFILRLGFALY